MRKLFEVSWSAQKLGLYRQYKTVLYTTDVPRALELVKELHGDKKDFFIHKIEEVFWEDLGTYEEAPF